MKENNSLTIHVKCEQVHTMCVFKDWKVETWVIWGPVTLAILPDLVTIYHASVLCANFLQ